MNSSPNYSLEFDLEENSFELTFLHYVREISDGITRLCEDIEGMEKELKEVKHTIGGLRQTIDES